MPSPTIALFAGSQGRDGWILSCLAVAQIENLFLLLLMQTCTSLNREQYRKSDTSRKDLFPENEARHKSHRFYGTHGGP